MIPVVHIVLLTLSVLYASGLLIFTIGIFLPDRRKSRETPFVSVIIAARNEESAIGSLLSDLADQTYPQERFEVIVADDRSTDHTAEIVRETASRNPNIHLLSIETVEDDLTPKKNAAQQAIRNSRGEIILTTDADCRVLPTWIEATAAFFTPETGMVVGFSQLGRLGDRQTLLGKFQAVDFLSLMSAAQGSLNLGLPLAASGQNLAYRRAAFDDAGGFTRIASRVSGDDVLLVQLVRKHTRWKIRFASSPDAFNTSRPESTLRDFLHQRMRWASNGAYMWRLNKPFFVYVLVTFLINLGLLVGLPIGFLSGNPAIPMLCLGLKAAAEALIIGGGCRVYRRWDLLFWFPLWFVAQIPYVVGVGLLGTFGRFAWKGRIHRPGAKQA